MKRKRRRRKWVRERGSGEKRRNTVRENVWRKEIDEKGERVVRKESEQGGKEKRSTRKWEEGRQRV